MTYYEINLQRFQRSLRRRARQNNPIIEEYSHGQIHRVILKAMRFTLIIDQCKRGGAAGNRRRLSWSHGMLNPPLPAKSKLRGSENDTISSGANLPTQCGNSRAGRKNLVPLKLISSFQNPASGSESLVPLRPGVRHCFRLNSRSPSGQCQGRRRWASRLRAKSKSMIVCELLGGRLHCSMMDG